MSPASAQSYNYDMNNHPAVENVLRRAEISRLTRNLKSRLALATFKTQRGLQNVGLDSIEQYHAQRGGTDKREWQSAAKQPEGGLQQGFTPSQAAPQTRKRARTYDSMNMPAPQGLPQSTSMPSDMHRSNFSHLQPPAMLSVTSPDSSVSTLDNGEPRTPPPPSRRHEATTPVRNANPDRDADLLLHFATSPGRAVGNTPRTPDVNFHEYLNLFTPSPQVNRQHTTPKGLAHARKRLEFN